MDPLSLASLPLTLHASMKVVAMAVGIVFAYAAVTKLVNVPGLIAAIQAYKIVPGRLASFSAGLLIAGEVLIALAHLTGIGLRLAVIGTMALLSIFGVFAVTLIKRGDKRPCLCFGADRDEPFDRTSLVRISVLWVTEGLLYCALTISDGMTSVNSGRFINNIASLLLAALAVALASWFLAFSKIVRTWQLARS